MEFFSFQDDEVYMDDISGIEEYVENQVGIIFTDYDGQVGQRLWFYDQFKPTILPAIIRILQTQSSERLTPEKRGDMSEVARFFAKMVDANDDNGIIAGNWGKHLSDFAGGVYPWSWTRSAPIIEQYIETGKPVKYGQCWVYSAVLTTIFRALGCPSRPISNFNSGLSNSIDLVIDSLVNEESEDSYWNFHVWTEVWMKRYGFTEFANGWQAVDGTPQTIVPPSTTYGIGPASVNFVWNAEIINPYETLFMYSAVNSDFLRWRRNRDGTFEVIDYPLTNKIGKLIVTKRKFPAHLLNSNIQLYEDVSYLYKPREGSEDERKSFYSAAEQLNLTLYSRPTTRYRRAAGEPPIKMVSSLDPTVVGEPLRLRTTLFNLFPNDRAVDINVRIASIVYNGTLAERILDKSVRVLMKPNQQFQVEADDYLNKLVHRNLITICITAQIVGTDFQSYIFEDFKFSDPKLELEIENHTPDLKVLTIKFKNSLPYDLTNCVYGIRSIHSFDKNVNTRTVKAKEEFVFHDVIHFEYPCVDVVNVILSCNEINDLHAYKAIIFSP
ncbi:Hemocyte protein-glutamine gamma-glutamyltransferase-like protein [Dinothrombium tinctorium]|uniref:Hemocyte protein-glutamine gamma-glutamyltransferase-like protein n=1 Tax=Dinothrombium tinctorium TaxID=1965070 RepID=A0A3S3NLF4_9ACAR|nr:Hemocyte protein-glutamine gamma-glutamyltransferase-like protein [Dinothrombium tinctorium]RWS01875.1 Hemocyte protein-glutamine gamma-glutamyltransferase-like protein [Dinothrombium tinctorium]RWS03077.1 Hemocyte protein-glutamine gamma-glutamyltransferase-like protein [Dinothrombium tinctorium]